MPQPLKRHREVPIVDATDAAVDWNVIVTLPEATFREARKFIRRWGEMMAETILVIAFPALIGVGARPSEGSPSTMPCAGRDGSPHIKCHKTLKTGHQGRPAEITTELLDLMTGAGLLSRRAGAVGAARFLYNRCGLIWLNA
jgi:hypothetical protein